MMVKTVVVMTVMSGVVPNVVGDRDEVWGKKNSQPPLLPSSSKEDSLDPRAFMLLLREMTDNNQKQPELKLAPQGKCLRLSPQRKGREENLGEKWGRDLEGTRRGQIKRVFYKFCSVMGDRVSPFVKRQQQTHFLGFLDPWICFGCKRLYSGRQKPGLARLLKDANNQNDTVLGDAGPTHPVLLSRPLPLRLDLAEPPALGNLGILPSLWQSKGKQSSQGKHIQPSILLTKN